jgi:hypothetical protein
MDKPMVWNDDISQAPKGYYEDVVRNRGNVAIMSTRHVKELIIAAGNEGVVTLSWWMPEEKRWSMFTKDVPPNKWMHFPDHPDKKD